VKAPVKPVVAYLGPQGSFSHDFAVTHFGDSSVLCPINEGGFEALIGAVADSVVDQAVIPIFNSNGSHIQAALKAFGDHLGRVFLHGCYPHQIIHNLVVNDEFSALKVIKTKPEVYLQCRDWLSRWGDVKRIDCKSTSAALKEVRDAQGNDRKFVGAICNELAVSYYGGKIKVAGIQDPRNITLFAVISNVAPSSELGQILICLTCPEKECYEAARQDFENAGHEFMHGTMTGAFKADVPLWLEFTQPKDDLVPLAQLLDYEHRHLLGGFEHTNSISTFITSIFDDVLIDDSSTQY
jgi:chorismate mutase/prephenate dehydratase